MSLEIVQKPVRTSFRVEDLAISSRVTGPDQSEAIVYKLNWHQSHSMYLNTPEKSSKFAPNATSTPLSSIVDNPEARISPLQLKRKRTDEIIPANSFGSSISESESSITSCSDDNDEGPRKKARCIFTSTQVRELEKCYNINKYLPTEERPLLAKRLKLSQQQVKTWFQNRRMKAKRQQKSCPLITYVDAAGTQYSSSHNTGYSTMQFPGHFSFNSENKVTSTTPTFMYNVNSLPPFEYNKHIYNGLTPQLDDQQ